MKSHYDRHRRGRALRQRSIGGHNLTIQGQRINIYVAKQLYRCAECFGPLVVKDFGLVCEANQTHRHFAHQREVAAIETKQFQNVEKLKQVYEIVDGKVVVKCQS